MTIAATTLEEQKALTGYDVVWKPLTFPNGEPTSQAYALDSRARITLYCGTRGPGKTECQLMRFRRHVGVGYGRKWQGVIFDHHYKNLDDLILKSKELFGKFDDGAKWHSSTASYFWEWPTGERLYFRAASKLSDYEDYHGHEYPFIGWNELTKYASPDLFNKMMSVNRATWQRPETGFGSDLPDIPLEVFATTNSYGAGRNWVKARFIDVADYGEIVKTEVDLPKPGDPSKTVRVVLTQVAIFGSWKENKYLPEAYIAELMQEPNQALRESWVNGSWDIVAGGAFDDVWKTAVHVLPRFPIPKQWRVDRCFDWGSTKPFYVGWVAECDGTETEFEHNGSTYTFGPPAGTLIVVAEWYGCKRNADGSFVPNTGLKLSSGDIAKGILEYEDSLQATGWLSTKPLPGPADNQITNTIDTQAESIETFMAREGVRWTRSDKSAGAPRIGLELMRERLLASRRREGAGLYFMSNCKAAISTIPVLPRDEDKPDVVDKNAEDHPFDGIRYRCLAAVRKLTSRPTVKVYS